MVDLRGADAVQVGHGPGSPVFFRSIGRKASQRPPSLALIELPPSPYRDNGLSGVARIGGERGLFLILPVELNTKSIVFSPRFFQEMLHELRGVTCSA